MLVGCPESVEVRFAPEVLDLGEVPVGGGAIGSVELMLASVGPASMTVAVEPESAPFRVLRSPPGGIAQGDHHFLTVEFRPDRAGLHGAVLAIEADAGDGRRRLDLELRGTGVAVRPDRDRDGWVDGPDCDDLDASVHPGATEICDGQDQDCDGVPALDELDLDGDGIPACEGDCDDDDDDIGPGQPEICDGADSDCDGDLPPDELDLDGDTFPPCAGDCADLDPGRHPAQPEFCDGLDTNCDGVLFAEEQDNDGDGAYPCQGDCDDGNALRGPGFPELCDLLDDDCDGVVPADETDLDGDGFYACDSDCDDTNGSIHENADEACNGVDDDCDGAPLPSEVDDDGDGFLACGECDDTDPALFPGGVELCDGIDGDCDGAPGVGEVDVDADGFLACAECDDANPEAFPGATELCNGVDEDCDGLPGAGEHDLDGDGVLACEDCDDGNANTYPGAPELCDRLDNDCGGGLDADEVDGDVDGSTPCEGDCDDADPALNPAETDDCYDEVDQDCDGVVNTGCTCPQWVAPTSPTCGTPGTYDCPHTDVQDAIDAVAASTCDEVWILPGTYVSQLVVASETELVGVGDRDQVVLDGDSAGTVLTGSGPFLRLESLTVTGGLGHVGGLHVTDGDVEIEDVVFVDNHCDATGEFGGASLATFGEASVVDSVFDGNTCTEPDGKVGGLASHARPTQVEGCLLTGNAAPLISALEVPAISGGTSTVAHNTIVGNTISPPIWSGLEYGVATVFVASFIYFANNLVAANEADGGAAGLLVIYQLPETVVANNVIVENTGTLSGGLQFVPTSSSLGTYSGNVIAGNSGAGVVLTPEASYSDPFFPPGLQYNNVWGNSVDVASDPPGVLLPPLNLSVDPGFTSWSLDMDPSNDDFSLLATSPLIDAGDPATGSNDPDGTRNDLGLFGGPYGDWAGP